MAASFSEFQTTNQHTFTAPQRMPGYAGFCPDIRHGYGETYGSATAAFFHDYRQRHLSGWRGDDHHRMPFPVLYNDPTWIASTRDRSRARWLPRTVAYDVSNAHKSQSEVLDFDRKCQDHREWYKDRSQSVPPVPYIAHAPTPLQTIEMEHFNRRWLPQKPTKAIPGAVPGTSYPGQFDLALSGLPADGPSSQRSLSYSNRMSSGRASASARGSSGRPQSSRPMSSKRDRAMRDKVFENRVGYD